MSKLSQFKQLSDQVYYFSLDEIKSCTQCSEALQNSINNNRIPSNCQLIFDTGSRQCSIDCSKRFLSGISHFKSISYVLNKQSGSYSPFGHAALVQKTNPNTHFFANYDDAYIWCTKQ